MAFGFLPVEEFARTLNSVYSGDIRKMLGGRVNPVVGSFLDYWYSADSFAGTSMGTKLPAKYTAVIPKSVQKLFGLVEQERPKYSGGEVVGTEKVLHGHPDSIFFFRRFPITSRQFSDIATLMDLLKKGKTKSALFKYFAGIRTFDFDPVKSKRYLTYRERKALKKVSVERGGGRMTIEGWVPKNLKKTDRYKEAIERTRANR